MAADPKTAKPKSATYWTTQLHLAERERKDWVQSADQLEKRYRSEKQAVLKGKRGGKRLNILYSNTETLKSALYARTPKPDVRRRFLDRDPVARTGAEIIERALIYTADCSEHDQAYRAGVLDSSLVGRGIVWYEYEAETEDVETLDPVTMQPMMSPAITEQEVEEHYVYWQDFLHSPARCWDDVWWIARRHKMSREDLTENGFENADSIPLDWSPDLENGKDAPDEIKRAEVWEIWHEPKKERLWVVKGYPKVLRVDPDPYGLDEFWPTQGPLNGLQTNDTMIPTPDFEQYRDQADDLDEITSRISVLTKALRRRGVYDSTIEELRRLARAGDNEFIGSDKMQNLTSKGGLAAAFQTEDIQPIAVVLIELYKQRDQLIQAIYEITGISDIMRGASKASETATAQNIKAQFGSMRLKDRQREVQRWVRDGYRIKAELIVEHFEPEKLAQMCQMDVNDPLFQQAVALIKSDKARSYAVDIETDSTVFEDAEAEKQSRVELLTAMGSMAQQWLPIIQAAPETVKLFGEALSFGVRGFKAGRQMEDVIDETMQAIQQRMANPQPPPPDPAVEKAKADMAMAQEAHQMDMQAKQVDMQGKQFDTQANQAMKVLDLQVHREKAAIDLEKTRANAMMQPLPGDSK